MLKVVIGAHYAVFWYKALRTNADYSLPGTRSRSTVEQPTFPILARSKCRGSGSSSTVLTGVVAGGVARRHGERPRVMAVTEPQPTPLSHRAYRVIMRRERQPPRPWPSDLLVRAHVRRKWAHGGPSTPVDRSLRT